MSSWLLPAVTKEVQASDPTAVYWWFTEWMPAATTKDVKAVLRMRRASTNNVKVTPAYQTAPKRTDEPDAWAVLDAAVYLDGVDEQVCTGVVDLATTLESKFYVRFGVKVESNAGTDTYTRNADVTLIVSGRD